MAHPHRIGKKLWCGDALLRCIVAAWLVFASWGSLRALPKTLRNTDHGFRLIFLFVLEVLVKLVKFVEFFVFFFEFLFVLVI